MTQKPTNNKQTKIVNDISKPCLSACVDNKYKENSKAHPLWYWLSSYVVDEGSTMLSRWLGLVFYIPFSALALKTRRQKGHPARKNPRSTNSRSTVPDQAEEELAEPSRAE